MTYKAFILLATVSLAVFLIPKTAKAQWWNPFPQEQQASAPYQYFRGGIDRESFSYLHQLGGGQDDNGYYQQPVSVEQAWGSGVPDGVHGYRAKWDDQIHILYEVQNGQIVRQDYFFNRPVQQ
ncbi:hypothetical protein NDI45_19415 [Leptolyngbya sp. GB1-A1]|uniref:hypothetical protein n=1 Tax=Leptolyngbya sp. GB1-A1 TaxID=2933908 RepID=UPI003299DCC5